jgi:hypothetical protein
MAKGLWRIKVEITLTNAGVGYTTLLMDVHGAGSISSRDSRASFIDSRDCLAAAGSPMHWQNQVNSIFLHLIQIAIMKWRMNDVQR